MSHVAPEEEEHHGVVLTRQGREEPPQQSSPSPPPSLWFLTSKQEQACGPLEISDGEDRKAAIILNCLHNKGGVDNQKKVVGT